MCANGIMCLLFCSFARMGRRVYKDKSYCKLQVFTSPQKGHQGLRGDANPGVCFYSKYTRTTEAQQSALTVTQ